MKTVLKQASYDLMRALVRGREMSASELGDYLQKSRQACEKTAHRLSQLGYLTRRMESFVGGSVECRPTYSLHRRGWVALKELDDAPVPRDYNTKEKKPDTDRIVAQAKATCAVSVFMQVRP